jgi:Reverse transcriptase (RNA-dependent DNA polymerase)
LNVTDINRSDIRTCKYHLVQYQLQQRKALYGLKQANRQRYAKMYTFLCEGLGFTRNAADHCFYVRIKGGQITLIALYVDDLLIACADKSVLDTIKRALSIKFEIKDMGEAQKCLGLEIFRCHKDGILTVSQSEYAKMVLARYEMAEVYGATLRWNAELTLTTQVNLQKMCHIVRRLEV